MGGRTTACWGTGRNAGARSKRSWCTTTPKRIQSTSSCTGGGTTVGSERLVSLVTSTWAYWDKANMLDGLAFRSSEGMETYNFLYHRVPAEAQQWSVRG